MVWMYEETQRERGWGQAVICVCVCVCVLHTQRTTRRASSLSSRALETMINKTICMDLYTFPYVHIPPLVTVSYHANAIAAIVAMSRNVSEK